MAWNFLNREKRSADVISTVQETSAEHQSFFINGVDINLLTNFRESRSLAAVYACIELIANSLSCIPLRVVKVDECGHIDIVKHHPV